VGGFPGFIASIGHPELRATVEAVFTDIGDAFKTPPGHSDAPRLPARLLEHTSTWRGLPGVAALYAEVDGDLAMAGILLHDIGKTIEYEGTLVTQRSARASFRAT